MKLQQLRCLTEVARRGLNVSEAAEALHTSQPGVSKHLRVLREVGLVKVRQEAQRHWYELRPEPLAEVTDWLEPYRRVMEERFDRLEGLLDELQDEEKKHGKT